jgi:pimeloyl-ACP methyl ester carboxylesterase
VLALPYPDGRLPRLAVDAGNDEIDDFWEFQQPMLERVIAMVPNISEEVRIAAGSSSGGHLVGSALDQKWRGFCDYFTGYVLHEGGHSEEMVFSGVRSSHRVLVIYGEKSTAKEWQEYFMERFKRARGRTDYIEVPQAGHGLNGEGRRLIRDWIETTFRKELESG